MQDHGRDEAAVFEVLNESLQELYVGTTDLPLEQLAAEHQRSFPRPLAHWRPEHRISYHYLDEPLPDIEAAAPIASYARGLEGYSLLVDAA
jgi:hypothetical protein